MNLSMSLRLRLSRVKRGSSGALQYKKADRQETRVIGLDRQVPVIAAALFAANLGTLPRPIDRLVWRIKTRECRGFIAFFFFPSRPFASRLIVCPDAGRGSTW